MVYKSLITFLFLCLASRLFSQENLIAGIEMRLLSDTRNILLKSEALNSINRQIITNESFFYSRDDSSKTADTIRTSIINKAHNYLGVKYRYGQSSEKGFDCSGFVKYVFHFIGLELPHSSFSLYKLSKHLNTSEAKSGDLVFFITRGKGVSHVGIYLGNNQFIHSPGKGRTVSIDSLGIGYYKRHLVGFGSVL